jgi:hypothetical protein
LVIIHVGTSKMLLYSNKPREIVGTLLQTTRACFSPPNIADGRKQARKG